MKKFFLILLLVSCTISTTKHEISREMATLKMVLQSISRNPFIKRKDLLETFNKFSNIRLYNLPKNSIYEYREEILNDTKFYIFENKKSDKVIYLLHGGAFFTGLFDIYKEVMNYIGENSKYHPSIYMIDYSVYPNKYPKAHNEVYEGYKYILEKYKNKDIIILGDSAGGHLAVSLVHKLRDKNISLPKGLILFSPWLDIENKVFSRKSNIHKDILIGNDYPDNQITEEVLNPSYFENADRNDKYVTPLNGNFKDFPYVYYQVDNTEMLLGDSLLLEKNIKKYDENRVSGDIFEGRLHDFQIFGKYTKEGMEALDLATKKIDEFYEIGNENEK